MSIHPSGKLDKEIKESPGLKVGAFGFDGEVTQNPRNSFRK
jgi:hypothetical protein